MGKSLEDRIVEKLFSGVNYLLSKWIKPDMKVDKVGAITREDIKRLKQEHGIRGMILDIDETLRSDMKQIPKVNEEWIDMIKEELIVIVVSNGLDRKVENFFALKGIDYIGFAHKPLKLNFRKAAKKMGLEPGEILVVGDDIFSDIYGGRRNHMKTMLVKSVETDEREL